MGVKGLLIGGQRSFNYGPFLIKKNILRPKMGPDFWKLPICIGVGGLDLRFLVLGFGFAGFGLRVFWNLGF